MTRTAKIGIAAALAAALVGLAGCSAGTTSQAASESVVIDRTFDVQTLDPARMFSATGNLVLHHIYQTLLTFEGSDITTPVDGLASYEFSEDFKVMTLTMKGGATFSDGTPVTVDDAVFSLQRLQGIAGNPSFLLENVVVAKASDTTLTLTSPEPNPTLAAILPSPSLGIVNSKEVKSNGGTIDDKDTAEAYLNETSAGSGPYMLESADINTQFRLKLNPNFTGNKPVKTTVVIRNVGSDIQVINVQSGESQIAIDLNSDQIRSLDAAKTNVQTGLSTSTIFLLLNQSSTINKWTANPKFLEAVKYAIDYDQILSLAGPDAVRPGGVVPQGIAGAIDSQKGVSTDLAAAKIALEESGYNGDEIELGFPSDLSEFGVFFQPLAESIQAQLKELGINVTLAPKPTGPSLDSYRAGKEQMTIWSWIADYPDPSDYLLFLPGEIVGLRGNWSAGSAELDSLKKAAIDARDQASRVAAYEELQAAMASEGPFIVLAQPAANIVSSVSINSVVPNAMWGLNIDTIK